MAVCQELDGAGFRLESFTRKYLQGYRISDIQERGRTIKENYAGEWSNDDETRIKDVTDFIKAKLEEVSSDPEIEARIFEYRSILGDSPTIVLSEEEIEQITSWTKSHLLSLTNSEFENYVNSLKKRLNSLEIEIENCKSDIQTYQNNLNRVLEIEQRKEKIAEERARKTFPDDLKKLKKSLIYDLMHPSIRSLDSDSSISLREGLLVGSKKIKIPNQNPKIYDFSEGEESKEMAFSGQSSVDEKTGDIILELPTNNIQVFEKVEILEQNPKYIKLAITERQLDGTSETWHLEFGADVKTTNEKGEEKLCANIICESGEKTSLIFGEAEVINMNLVHKPIIAIRGIKEGTEFTVKVILNNVSCKIAYPLPNVQETANEQKTESLIWRVTALPNNSIQVEDKKYPYLFWDGLTDYLKDEKFENGFCVAKDKVIEFLEEKCALFGFDEQLTTDFVTFWAPYLMQNEYNLVRWLTDKECQELAKLEISCKEKLQIIRMYMVYKPVNKKVKIKEQKIEKVKLSNKPKVFDWGGFGV